MSDTAQAQVNKKCRICKAETSGPLCQKCALELALDKIDTLEAKIENKDSEIEKLWLKIEALETENDVLSNDVEARDVEIDQLKSRLQRYEIGTDPDFAKDGKDFILEISAPKEGTGIMSNDPFYEVGMWLEHESKWFAGGYVVLDEFVTRAFPLPPLKGEEE